MNSYCSNKKRFFDEVKKWIKIFELIILTNLLHSPPTLTHTFLLLQPEYARCTNKPYVGHAINIQDIGYRKDFSICCDLDGRRTVIISDVHYIVITSDYKAIVTNATNLH